MNWRHGREGGVGGRGGERLHLGERFNDQSASTDGGSGGDRTLQLTDRHRGRQTDGRREREREREGRWDISVFRRIEVVSERCRLLQEESDFYSSAVVNERQLQ